MAVLASYISTTNAANSMHLDYNGGHFGVRFSYTGSNDSYIITSIDVMLSYRLNQSGGSGTHTDIQCGVRDYARSGGVIIGGSGEGNNLTSATSVSTSILTTYGYYESPVGNWVSFVFNTAYEFTSAHGYAFVLSLDTPTVLDPSPPYSAVPMWGTRSTGTFDFIYKTTAGNWAVWNNRRGIFRVNGSEVADEAPGGLVTFPPSRPDDYDPDLIWQPGEWTGPTTYVPGDWGAGYVATGGGRWGQNLVVCGNKKIYYEPFEGV